MTIAARASSSPPEVRATSSLFASLLASRAFRWARNVTFGILGLTVLVGLLHLPVFHGLLMKVGGCPVAGATPETVDRARLFSIGATARAAGPAPMRPALGFVLDASTRADVDAWAAKGRVSCDALPGGVVKCVHVPARLLGEIASFPEAEDVTFAFAPSGKLVNVAAFRRIDAEHAAEAGAFLARSLEASLGPPPERQGAFQASALAVPLGGASVTYRFHDYVAEITAVHLTGTVVLREHYLSGN